MRNLQKTEMVLAFYAGSPTDDKTTVSETIAKILVVSWVRKGSPGTYRHHYDYKWKSHQAPSWAKIALFQRLVGRQISLSGSIFTPIR
jgi:hypothetical protein